jgi:FeS assembly SUF system protein
MTTPDHIDTPPPPPDNAGIGGPDIQTDYAELDDEMKEAMTPSYTSIPGDERGHRIIEELRHVYDPEIPVNIYELGLIYEVAFLDDGENAHVKMTLTAPNCPVAGEMPGWVENAVQSAVPDLESIDVEIVWDPPWTPDMMADTAKLQLNMY